MRLAIAPAIASALLAQAASAPSLAWGADGIDVIRAGVEDMRAFDEAISKSRPKDAGAARDARANVRSSIGAKVTTEVRKVRDQRERSVQEKKNFGQWVKSSNNPSGGQGSAAAVGDDGGHGSGGASSSQDARDKSGKGSRHHRRGRD